MDEINEDVNCITKAFENYSVSILKETIDDKKQFYFRASDVGKVLDIVNIRSSVQNFTEREKGVREVDTIKGKQNVTFLTSRGVYRLLYSSKKKIAEKFRDWVGDILDDIIFNDSNELKKQLELKDKEIERLKVKHDNDLLDKDKEKHWLHLLTKNQISYKKFITKKDGIYQGSSEFENQNFIEKIGKSIDIKGRAKDFATATSPNNAFKMYKNYSLYKDMHNVTERYIHTILQPFRIISDDSSAKEHFMVHRDFVHEIMNKVVISQNEIIEMVNKYIDLLDENQFNYEIVAEIIKNNKTIYENNDLIKKNCYICKRNLDISSYYLKDDNTYVDNCFTCVNNQSNILLKKIETNPLNGNKICKKCNRILNFDMFFTSKEDPDTLWDDCRECHNTLIGKPTKQCVDCLDVYQYNKFIQNKYSKDGYNIRCTDCRCALKRENPLKKIKVICEYCDAQVLSVNLKLHLKSQACLQYRYSLNDNNIEKCQNCDLVHSKDTECSCLNKVVIPKITITCEFCGLECLLDNLEIHKSSKKCLRIQERINNPIKKVICKFCGIECLLDNLESHQKTKKCLQVQNKINNPIKKVIGLFCGFECLKDNLEAHKKTKKCLEKQEKLNNEDDSKKQCGECNQMLSLNNFYLKNGVENVYRSKCKSCCYKISNEHKKKVKSNPLHGKKECTKCELLLNYELFFSDESMEDGFLDICIGCYNKGKIKNKQCGKCKEILLITDFASDKTHTDGRSSNCKSCRMEAERIRRASKPKTKCEFCHKTVQNIKDHQKTKTCVAIQDKLKLEIST
jgi:prophage antirepressor-like protein